MASVAIVCYHLLLVCSAFQELLTSPLVGLFAFHQHLLAFIALWEFLPFWTFILLWAFATLWASPKPRVGP